MILELFITAMLAGSPVFALIDHCPHQAADHVLTSAPAGDVNDDGLTDGRDVQAYVDQALAPEPYSREWIERLKAHPHYLDVLNVLTSWSKWPSSKLADTPEAMIRTIVNCAMIEAFTGEWPRPDETLPILRRFRNEWPLTFTDHNITLYHIPTLVRAAKLSPTARDELDIPLRWCFARMLMPQLIGKAPTAMYSTSVGTGLRDMVMLAEVLYGEEAARAIALEGFGSDYTQWGLRRVVDDCIDDAGLLRVNVAGFNHIAWTNRPALVYLMEVKGYKRYLTAEQRAKWDKFYESPCRMLCVGGKTFTIPGVNDEYSMNPCIGPVGAWTRDTEIDRWARWWARLLSSPSFDWLLVPADPIDYVPPERPPGCSGDRDFGRVRLIESADGLTTRVEYISDGAPINAGHQAKRAVTMEVRK